MTNDHFSGSPFPPIRSRVVSRGWPKKGAFLAVFANKDRIIMLLLVLSLSKESAYPVRNVPFVFLMGLNPLAP